MSHSAKKSIGILLSVLLLISAMFPATVFADIENTTHEINEVATEYNVDLEIPLAADTEDATIQMVVSGKTVEELNALIAEGGIEASLTRNAEKVYNDPTEFPYQTEGGSLDSWMTQNNTPLFTDVEYAAAEEDGQVVLTVTFDVNCYFYSRGNVDYSAPHSNGGAYLDVCGYFDFAVAAGEDVLGTADVKVVPYTGFHTMTEMYSEISAIAATGTANGLYAQEFSMGYSTGGRNIPYLIIAKDEAAVLNWLAFTEQAETDPTGTLAAIEAGQYDDIKVPVMYSNIHSNEVAASDGIMDFAKNLVSQESISYDYLTGFTEEGEAQQAAEMGTPGEEGSTAIPELTAEYSTYLGYIQDGNGKSGVVDLEKYYTIDTKEVKISDLLEDVFFILVPEENVDGRTHITRAADNGYDLNRDNSFQTTSETQNMQKLIGTFNPVSFVEFHGRVQGFQLEPCDPPHEPNFEYDLLSEHLMKGGEALGIAAIANNAGYNSYVIPQRDYLEYTGNGDQTYWADPWDDMSTSYTPQFAMLQGTVSYTVELPAYNTETSLAVSYGIFGQADYIASAKLEYITAQTKIFERGVTNANSDAYELVGQWLTDQYDVEGAESEIFRPEYDGEGENGNFYPEAYIIALDAENQLNVDAAAEMLELLARNDVKINFAAEAFTIDEVEYPAGTAIVSMYQAKRSVANSLLYDGTLIQGWTVLYSEGITSFGETRGFDYVTVTKPADYSILAAAMGTAQDYDGVLAVTGTLTSSFSGVENADVIIQNISEESTSAINALLKNGATVGMITEGDEMGNFIVSYDDYVTVENSYILKATGVYGADYTAKVITKAPTIYATGQAGTASAGYINTPAVSSQYNYNYDVAALNLMNFNITTDPAAADVIIGASALNSAATAAVKAGTPYIGYANAGTRSVGSALGLSVTRASISGGMDALAYVEYPNKTLVNATYVNEGDDILYGYGAGYFSVIPEGATVLVTIDGTQDPTEGFLPTISARQQSAYAAYMNSSVQGFAYEGATSDGSNVDIVLFANSLTNKVHQRDEYSYISNFIFSKLLGEDYEGVDELGGTQNDANLAKAKLAAIKEITNYADTSLYRDAEKAEIAETVGATLAALIPAKTVDQVNGILAEAKAAIDALPTDAELTAEEEAAAALAAAKEEAIADLNNYVPEYMSEEDQVEVDAIVVDAEAKIAEATTPEEVAEIVAAAKSAIDAAVATAPANGDRIYGSSRYETSLAVADKLKEIQGVEQFQTVVLASGASFADALAGGYLANQNDAPIILVNPAKEEETMDYVAANLVEGGKVYLLGGTGVVSQNVEDTLTAEGYDVTRLGGANRYETNLAILAEAGASETTILVADGAGFADSLSASAVDAPILLVNNAYTVVTPEQKAYLESVSPTGFVILGGTGAVSLEIEVDLAEIAEVTRLGGANRYETSALIADYFFPETENVVLSYGLNFPDGLSAGPLANALNAPLLLAASVESSYASAANYVAETAASYSIVLGGPTLIDDAAWSAVMGE